MQQDSELLTRSCLGYPPRSLARVHTEFDEFSQRRKISYIAADFGFLRSIPSEISDTF